MKPSARNCSVTFESEKLRSNCLATRRTLKIDRGPDGRGEDALRVGGDDGSAGVHVARAEIAGRRADGGSERDQRVGSFDRAVTAGVAACRRPGLHEQHPYGAGVEARSVVVAGGAGRELVDAVVVEVADTRQG